MMIINSRQIKTSPIFLQSSIKKSSNKPHSSQKTKEQKLIMEWIHSSFGIYPHCKKIQRIQQLKSGVVLAQIVYNLLPPQINQQQNFLENILINNLNQTNCIHNISVIFYIIQKYFQCFETNYNLTLYEFSKPQQLYANTDLMKTFFIKVIMKIPQMIKTEIKITSYPQKIKLDSRKSQVLNKFAKNKENINIYSQSKQSNNGGRKSQNFVGIEDLSEIANIQNLQFQSKTTQKYQNYYQQKNDKPQSKSNSNRMKTQNQYQSQSQNYINNNIQSKLKNQKQKQNIARDQIYLKQQKQQRICLLLDWIHDTYNLPIEQLQAHQLLGQLTNCVLGNSRLNQRIVKPTHFQMGSACVYRKVVDAFLKCERINKVNLIEMSCDIQNGIINQQIYWKVIQDIWCLVNNKISFIQLHSISSHQKLKFENQEDMAGEDQKQKQNNPILQNQKLQINYKVHQNAKEKNKKQSKPSHPLYDKILIQKVQMWLEQLGFSYSLGKSKEIKIIKNNPLLNGTLIGSLIIRLKIAKPILIKQLKDLKQVAKNIQQIKVALIKRGYECARKLDIYRAGINFYLGLIGQIHSIYQQKQNIKKSGIANELRYKKQCKQMYKIFNKEKQQIIKWIMKQFSIELQIQQQIQISILFQVFQACINSTLLRETTQKIVQININRILQDLRNLGLSQYYGIKVDDITSKDSQIKNDIKWMILKDLKSVICGSRGLVQYYNV